MVSQHCLLLMDMVFKMKITRKVKFRKKLKLWKMRESELKEEFAEVANNKCDGNEEWCALKKKLLDVVSEVCGYTKGKPKHFEMWRWNEDVDVALCRKRTRRLVVSDLRLETKCSRFGSGCYLCAEVISLQ